MADGGESIVFMDPDRVLVIAKGLDTVSAVLKAVSTTLEGLMEVLKATAFIGLVGGTAVERYIASIKPPIDQLAQLCSDLSKDANNSVQKWRAASERV